jgi:hypothetical protein
MLTVLQQAKSKRLVSAENVRADLGLSEAKWPSTRLTRMIDQASAMATSFCERTFGRQIYRERVYAVRPEGLLMGAGPVNRIVAVGIPGGAAYADHEYLLQDGRLLLQDSFGAGIGDGSAYNLWQALRPSLVVDYEAGWILPEDDTDDPTFTGGDLLPADIEKAVIQLISVAVSEAGRDVTVKSDTVEGVGSRSFYVQGAASKLPHPGAEATLEHYRVVTLV